MSALFHTYLSEFNNYNLPQYCMQGSDYHRQKLALLVHAKEGSLRAMRSLDSERCD